MAAERTGRLRAGPSPEDQSSGFARTDSAALAEDWADRIRPHLAAAVESIVAAGREFSDAKRSLPHGEFGRCCELLGVTTRTAQRFMAIAGHPVLSDATHASHLPASWTTLHELSRLEPALLAAAIDAGTVTPKLDRKAARQLVVQRTIEANAAARSDARAPWDEQTERELLAARLAHEWASLGSAQLSLVMRAMKLTEETERAERHGVLLDAHAQLARLIFSRIMERQIDAELRELLEAEADGG